MLSEANLQSPGTYLLILRAPTQQRILVGKLGAFTLSKGPFVYVGSAFGPGGLGARLKHHLKKPERPHWHIDYLREFVIVEAIWITREHTRREHDWTKVLRNLHAVTQPLPGFGSSDCRCRSHLFHLHTPTVMLSFRREVRRHFPHDQPIETLSISDNDRFQYHAPGEASDLVHYGVVGL